MFIVLLKFGENRSSAPEHMQGHKDWLEAGFAEGVFIAAGSLQPGLGGGILAMSDSRDEVEARIGEDPFVIHRVVEPEVIEFDPSRLDDRLAFLRIE